MVETAGGPAAWALLLSFLAGYLLGSIPFGLVLTRSAGLGDIRAIGSGNIGATNVLRTGSKSLAAATLLLDVAQGRPRRAGRRAVRPGRPWRRVPAPSSAISSPSGSASRAARASPPPAASSWASRPPSSPSCWSASSRSWPSPATSPWDRILAAAFAPLVAWLLGDGYAAGLYLLVAVLVVGKHHANIRRLLAGEESKLSFGGAKG